MKSMTKKQCIIACAAINIVFIFGHIYNHTQRVKYTYEKEQHERHLLASQQKIQELTQQLYALKDRNAVQLFAEKELNMMPIPLKNVRRLASL